jgi:hypothetical protein
MQQSDYLLRQIEQLGRVLGKILADLLGLKNQGEAHAPFDFASAAFLNELDMDLPALLALPESEWIPALTALPNWNESHLETFADILLELAEGLDSRGERERAETLYPRALLLYRYLDESGAVFSFERHNKMDRILNRSSNSI